MTRAAHGAGVWVANAPQRLLRRHIVEERTGLSRSTIYALIAQGLFPRPRRVAARAVAWLERDIGAWIAELPQAVHADTDEDECA